MSLKTAEVIYTTLGQVVLMSLTVFAALLVLTVLVQLLAVPLTAWMLKLVHENRHTAMELEILLMLVLVLHLVNEAVKTNVATAASFALGLASLALLSKGMRRDKRGGLSMMQNAGVLLLIAVSIHELAEGSGFGSSYALSLSGGLLSALLIAAHNIPEASVVSLQYLMNGGLARAFRAVAATQVFYALGAFAVFALSFAVAEEQQAMVVAFSAGSILYISLEELWLMRKIR